VLISETFVALATPN